MTSAMRCLLAGLAASTLLAQGAAAGDARALTDSGHVLTVGNWTLASLDGGVDMRIADDATLGWELRDGNGMVLAEGLVPATEGAGLDATPALSRSPATGELLLAWSRQAAPGLPREIALQRFGASGWVSGSLTILASDIDDQMDPALVHDDGGTAWIAWIDGANERIVRFAGVAADGRLLGSEALSEGVSTLNGAPTIGIDAVGKIVVAHAGTPVVGGDVTLFVLVPNPTRGGISHLPDPIIEFGLRGAIPAPSIGGEATGSLLIPGRVNLTVLGGTPVAWWTEAVDGSLARFRYVAESSGSWTGSELRTLDLRSGMVATIPDALALVEARLRRVIVQAPGNGTPAPPSRTSPGRIQTLR